jgi:sigma-B regulation protein RsbU (phosphoserine phosphatase)
MDQSIDMSQMEYPMISVENKIEMLRNCKFLAGAPEVMLCDLADKAGTLRVSGEEAIVTKGETGSTMYIIISGRVHVHDGNVSRAHLGEGEVFGEMSVLDNEVRSATVTTECDSMLLSIERADLFDALSANPGCFKGILQAVLHREREIVQLVQTRSEKLLGYEKELEIGRRIQADFLPEAMPQIENWEIATCFEAAREVAGDFLDAFTLNTGSHVAIVVGDVCDKGVGAALYMTLFRSLIRASCLYGYFDLETDNTERPERPSSISDILMNSIVTTNKYIATTHPRSSMFASVFFGLLEPKTGEMKYINAGHEAPAIFHQDGTSEVLEITGGVLGLFPAARFSISSVKLNPGDLLFAYTDGVNEAKNLAGDQFTEQRILDIEEPAAKSASEFIEHVIDQIKDFRGEADQSDDITMIALRYLAGEAKC